MLFSDKTSTFGDISYLLCSQYIKVPSTNVLVGFTRLSHPRKFKGPNVVNCAKLMRVGVVQLGHGHFCKIV